MARPYTTSWGLLKQPDKQKLANLLDLAGPADARPTKSEYDVLEYLSTELKQREEFLERLRQAEWTPFAALAANQPAQRP